MVDARPRVGVVAVGWQQRDAFVSALRVIRESEQESILLFDGPAERESIFDTRVTIGVPHTYQIIGETVAGLTVRSHRQEVTVLTLVSEDRPAPGGMLGDVAVLEVDPQILNVAVSDGLAAAVGTRDTKAGSPLAARLVDDQARFDRGSFSAVGMETGRSADDVGNGVHFVLAGTRGTSVIARAYGRDGSLVSERMWERLPGEDATALHRRRAREAGIDQVVLTTEQRIWLMDASLRGETVWTPELGRISDAVWSRPLHGALGEASQGRTFVTVSDPPGLWVANLVRGDFAPYWERIPLLGGFVPVSIARVMTRSYDRLWVLGASGDLMNVRHDGFSPRLLRAPGVDLAGGRLTTNVRRPDRVDDWEGLVVTDGAGIVRQYEPPPAR